MKHVVIIIALLLTGSTQRASAEANTTGKNKDAVVRAECINVSAGVTVGFRVEVMNPSQDKNLVLVVRDSMSSLFHIQLINENGLDISPLRSPVSSGRWGPYPPLKNKHEIILPGSNCFCFIPVPSQVRIDLVKPNENNLKPTPDGKYMAEILVTTSYFIQDKEEKSIPKSPKFQSLRLTLPRIPIIVDSKQLGQNIEDMYRGELSGSETNKQTQVSPINNPSNNE
ncbi:MAG: hypothetical protein PHP98_04680 [Kiritimatiellae bacterium]|jgi:hypothetical protein|nr:hypothetical protein [Kiritimatiellia bacterium]